MARRSQKGDVIGDCRLCGRRAKLMRSHIIPEFFYRSAYDAKHRVLEIGRSARPRLLQKGFREHLMCDRCETFLNEQYEKPMKSMWLDSPKLPAVIGGNQVFVAGLDYARFKLFHLSVLWRAAVATTGEYANIDLGSHEAALRNMLLSVNPGPPMEYPIIGLVLLLPPDGAPAFDVIQATSYSVVDGVPIFRTVYGGCAWQVALTNRPVQKELSFLSLTTGGSILLLCDDMRLFEPLGRVWYDYQKAAKEKSWPDPWRSSAG